MEMTKPSSQTDRETFAAVFLIGLLCLMVELTQVRMLSFFLGSISNFLAIPIALFGLSLGSLYCHFFHKGDKDRMIQIASALLFPLLLLTFLSFFAVADTFFPDIHMAKDKPGKETARLLVYAGLFVPSYFVFGVLLSAYFSARAEIIGRLYFFDLVGAGLGCLLTSLLFTYADLPPVIVAVLFGAALVLFNARVRLKSVFVLSAFAVLILVQAAAFKGRIFKEHPNPEVVSYTLFGRSVDTGVEEVWSEWNHLTRTGLYRNHATHGDPAASRFVIVQDDGISNVSVFGHTPSFSLADVEKFSMHHVFSALLKRKPEDILVMFAGAGKDMILLNAVTGGTANITGVELNESVKTAALHPALYNMNLRQFFEKPNIRYIIREGRDFLNNDKGRYDIILAATNGAVHAGRTGHTRKYLDTYEACRSYLDHLNDDGLIIFVNQPVERKIESFRKLFEDRRIGALSERLYAFSAPGSHTLQSAVLQKKPFKKWEIDAMEAQRKKIRPGWEVIHSPFHTARKDFEPFVTVPPDKRAESLVTDDLPFTRPVSFSGFELFPEKSRLTNPEYASDWIKIFTCILFAAVSLLVIVVARFGGAKDRRLPFVWLLYFFVSGISYMGVEIGLIAKTELFVGNPLYAVAVILAVFLVSNGIGAYVQDRFHIMRGIKSLLLITVVTIAWGLLWGEVFNRTLLSIPMVWKVLCVAFAVMPSGTALGMYYPLGVATLVRTGRESSVPVTYAAATLSSVLGSALAVTLITNVGFSTIIASGAAGYAVVAVIFGAARRMKPVC